MKEDTKGPRITAHSFYRELRSYGFDRNQILHVITELVELVIHSVQSEKSQPELTAVTVASEEESQRGSDLVVPERLAS